MLTFHFMKPELALVCNMRSSLQKIFRFCILATMSAELNYGFVDLQLQRLLFFLLILAITCIGGKNLDRFLFTGLRDNRLSVIGLGN
jgi:hypothetical protein